MVKILQQQQNQILRVHLVREVEKLKDRKLWEGEKVGGYKIF